MRKILIIYLIVALTVNLIAQQKIINYNLEKENNAASTDLTQQSNTIEKILIQNNIIWLATSKGLSKSSDNGLSWINFYNVQEFGTESISSVGYGNGAIWASTWHYENKLGSDIPVGTGIKYSTNQGQTWNKIPQPVDDPGDSSIVYGINRIRALPVTVAEQNFIYDIAFTSNTIWIATFAGGLRKSTDMGQTWKRVVLPPDNLNSIKPTDTLKFSLQPQSGKFGSESYLNHRAFSVLAIDDNTIYVGTAGGINKSTDGGVSWIKFNHNNQTNPISGNFILSLEKNDYDNSIWAGTWKAEGTSEYWGVSSSSDGGQNWKTYLTDERVMDFGFKYVGNPGSYISADIFVATQNGCYRSSNNGSTWIAAPEIIDDNKNVSLNTKHFRTVKVNRNQDNSTDIWLGTINGLARLNETNGFWTGTWKVFLASEKLTSANDTYAFPNPFSPDAESIRIKYSTTQAANVTIRIFDFGMNLVKTLIQNVNKNINSENFEFWNGRDENGKIVPNGVYFYRIDLGGSKPLYGKIMVIM
ncbi:MAG: T9SS C-terminal target domain-containing protein [Ignavibacteriales bacterium]|nr:MAG: T9SS C-terminal target domain-containing protein [Ignavibacteriales bacterium]